MRVPLHAPAITDADRQNVLEAMTEHNPKGGGEYTRRVESKLGQILGQDEVLLTSSCTHSLEMAALLLDISQGDEVIVPSYTFPSTAVAFAIHGAEIKFCDINISDIQMDTNHLETLISEDTKAVVPVHYGGYALEIDRIRELADRYDSYVVEDAAQTVNSRYKDKNLGTFGDIGCYSFHGTKLYAAGEGGAISVQAPDLFERAEIIRQKGTNYEQFRRDEVEVYTWVDYGSSYVASELEAALLFGQLTRAEEIRKRKETFYELYIDLLSDLIENDVFDVPVPPANSTPNYHIFYLLMDSHASQKALLAHLNENGIAAASHYRPLHTSPMGQKYTTEETTAPNAASVSERIIRIPIGPGLTEADIRYVSSKIVDFCE